MSGHLGRGCDTCPSWDQPRSTLAFGPKARPGSLALFDREPDKRDAECINGFFRPLQALVQGLIQHIIVCPAQAAADDLLGKKGRAESPQAKNMGDTLHVPPLRKHIHADNGSNAFARLPLRTDGVDHLAEDSLIAFIRIEYLRVDWDGYPSGAVVVTGIAKQLIVAGEMIEEP